MKHMHSLGLCPHKTRIQGQVRGDTIFWEKKYVLAFLALMASYSGFPQQHSLVKLWETDSIIDVPESVLLDDANQVLYVSQMGKNPDDKDGVGGIAKIGLDGKPVNLSWITGLNAPKGLAQYKNTLYAADLTDVVVIDIKRGKVTQIIAIDSARFLNDVTVSDDGIVYVSDSRTAKIHRIEKGVTTLYLENIKGVNGLKAMGNDLCIAGGRTIWKASATKELTKVIELPQGIDGVEPVGNGDFLYSSWGGFIFYGKQDGTYEELLNTKDQGKNSADIDYDPVKKVLYIPTFWKKSVVAYELK